MKIKYSILFILLGMLSCYTTKVIYEENILPLVLDKKLIVNNSENYFKIDTAVINKNNLTLYVTYYNGCEKQEFKLLSKGNLTKSIPPVTNFYLISDFKPDNCKKKKVKHVLKFDILPFKQRYSKTIRINIFNYPNELIYEPI